MRRLQKYYCLLLAASFALLCSLNILQSAQGVEQKTIPTPGNIAADGENLWYIGDSYSDNDYMRQQVAKTISDNLFLDAQNGRRATRDYPDNKSGLTILRERIAAGKRPKYLIFELNTNDHDLSTEEATEELEQIRDLIGANTWLILMTAHSQTYESQHYNVAVLRAEKDERTLVADWEAATLGREELYISDDGLHPNDNGHRLLANLFKTQLDLAVETERKALE